MDNINRIAVLTSGGDAPGMNSAIRAVVRTADKNNIEVLGVRRGYNGLINGDVIPMESKSVRGITSMGGTILYTARCEEFRTVKGVEKAVERCKYLGIDAVAVIGGDGSFKGALELQKLGVSTIGIPATIDNDIGSTYYTIGFDTACNTAIDAIDKLIDTMQSHERISVVEVMGRHAGFLAIEVAIASGAVAVMLPERNIDLDKEVIEKIRQGRILGRDHFIIIVAEGVGNTYGIAEKIQKETGIETRVATIGYIQRGGSPSVRDRVMASRMGHYAVEALINGKEGIVVAYRSSMLEDIPMEESLNMKKDLSDSLLKVAYDISG